MGAFARQAMGSTATAFGWTRENHYSFRVGVPRWLAVGVLPNELAMMLVHTVALGGLVPFPRRSK